ncbi:hypothetical protein BOTBODRAFT_35132 [Botryobasidium botryosum FD-172 SS1]|uniref:Protein kinase domain-containing protein n=1 Tax=Botryobasidium botryosum (strain FD-172 SS1) TaxID=930990 RepID=A0A067M7Z7_BOTB1|nr:hypothetical protein BOTBODRAFT_35132 [Botryobasidium botryosum FD-172 SS1]
MDNHSQSAFVSIPRSLLEQTIDLLRKDMLRQHESHREQHVETLFQLYTLSGFYPLDPPLQEWEISEVQDCSSALGGSADIFQGLFLGRQRIALKRWRQFDPSVRMRRLQREADVWRTTRHPNILSFIGFMADVEPRTLISPWMDGGQLLEYMASHPSVNRFSLAAQIATGVEYLHTSNPPVIHGDLRGPNILVSAAGHACIADFGLSCTTLTACADEFSSAHSRDSPAEKSGGNLSQTYSTTWLLAGHPRWLSCELLAAETKEEALRTLRSDIFSFGRLLLELFTSKIPFSYLAHDMSVTLKVLNKESPQRPTNLDDHIWSLMEHCWHPDPFLRPNARDVARSLCAAVGPPVKAFQWYTNITFNDYDFSTTLPDPLPPNLQEYFLKEMAKLREKMVYHLPEDPTESLESLAQVYSAIKCYPSDILHECEVAKSKSQPSGEGGFGKCWEGLFLGRHKVALKCTHCTALDRERKETEREVRVWKHLRHPNILPFIGSVTLDSEPRIYLVSPWMDSGDALRFVNKNRHIDCVKLLLQIAEGLKYLHSHNPGVVHGDIKATNIFISDQGDARIGDFGLSHDLAQGITGNFSTAWTNAGNPRWQAPELLSGVEDRDDAVSRRTTHSDMFAFGRVVLELFTGAVPFAQNLSSMSIAVLVMTGINPAKPSAADIILEGFDDSIWGMAERCWQTDPSARPTADEMSQHLQALISSRSLDISK